MNIGESVTRMPQQRFAARELHPQTADLSNRIDRLMLGFAVRPGDDPAKESKRGAVL